jgi:hypothetical protein
MMHLLVGMVDLSKPIVLHQEVFAYPLLSELLSEPKVWYDLVHMLEVLSRFPWLRENPRLLDMLGVLKRKMDPQGRFTLESAWMAWKGWEFGQKKVPSRWLTLTAWRIMGITG